MSRLKTSWIVITNIALMCAILVFVALYSGYERKENYGSQVEHFVNSIIAMEHCNVYESKVAGLHELRAFAAAGAFDKAKAIVTGPLDCDREETLLQVINKEVGRRDMLIMENVDFIHRTPMTVLPVGAKTEVDCDKPAIRILEAGVS